MDSNKLYCRNSTPATTSASSSTSNGIGTTTSQDACDSNYSAGGFNCKESFPRSNNSSGKSSHNLRVNNCSVAYGGGIGNSTIMSVTNAASVASSNGHCNSSNGSGNYINVMSVPIGALQYNRRKLTPQEYQ